MKFTLFTALATIAAAAKMNNSRNMFRGQKLVTIEEADEKVAELAVDLGVDIWDDERTNFQVLLDDSQRAKLQEAFPEKTVRVESQDIQAVINEEADRINASSEVKTLDEEYFTEYRTYDEAYAAFQTFASEHPDTVEFIPSIGQSVNGRDLFAVKVNYQDNPDKSVVYGQSLQHAREWISLATTSYVIYDLTLKLESDEAFKAEVADIEFVWVPIVNPDGYDKTFNGNRLWRKNRALNSSGREVGVDLNRNYAYNWGGPGASPDEGNDTYRGPSVFSEPESQAVRDFFENLGNVVAAVDWHCYSQLLLRPVGDTREDAPYEAEHFELAESMRSILQGFGARYTNQKGIDLYATTGTAGDYFSITEFEHDGKKHFPYAFTFEGPPRNAFGATGFILNSREIVPTGQMFSPVVVELAKTARDKKLYA